MQNNKGQKNKGAKNKNACSSNRISNNSNIRVLNVEKKGHVDASAFDDMEQDAEGLCGMLDFLKAQLTWIVSSTAAKCGLGGMDFKLMEPDLAYGCLMDGEVPGFMFQSEEKDGFYYAMRITLWDPELGEGEWFCPGSELRSEVSVLKVDAGHGGRDMSYNTDTGRWDSFADASGLSESLIRLLSDQDDVLSDVLAAYIAETDGASDAGFIKAVDQNKDAIALYEKVRACSDIRFLDNGSLLVVPLDPEMANAIGFSDGMFRVYMAFGDAMDEAWATPDVNEAWLWADMAFSRYAPDNSAIWCFASKTAYLWIDSSSGSCILCSPGRKQPLKEEKEAAGRFCNALQGALYGMPWTGEGPEGGE